MRSQMTSYTSSYGATSASGSNPSSPQNKKGCVVGELEGNYREEQEKFQAMLNAEARRCDEAELFMKNEEELIAIIMELRKKVAKEESDKLAVTICLAKEKEARVSAEKLQSSLSEEVTKYQGELEASNQKLSSVNEMYKSLREYNTSVQQYNTSLQQYNTKLESELAAAKDNLKRVEKENAALVENLSTARGHNKSLQDISGASS
ncbi:unnamed protein product [Rhodiola kirilowii]